MKQFLALTISSVTFSDTLLVCGCVLFSNLITGEVSSVDRLSYEPSHLMNRFRWGELSFKHIFLVPWVRIFSPFPYLPSSQREGPTADPEKWLLGIVLSSLNLH